MARHRSQATPELQHRWLEIGPTPRSYWLAPAPQPHAPLLVVLHGLGMTGKDMAAFTGLATRGPAAGFTAVFPDGWEKVWNDGLRRPRRRGIDDTEFILALLDRLAADGLGRRDAVVLAGISNGASFAEHLSRHGLVEPGLSWHGAGSGPAVVLYRIEGGGHGWPGGPQYLPARVIGPVSGLDATGILLDTARREIDSSDQSGP